MDAGGGALAGGEQAGQGRTAVGVGPDPAHVVVRRRGDGDRLDARIDPGSHAGGEDGGELVGESRSHRLAGVQEGAAARAPLGLDGAGDDVAGGQFGGGMVAGHEGAALAVDQLGALAAQGFGGQRRGVGADVDGGGVELDELGIDDLSPGQGGQGQALAPDLGRIGGDGVEAAKAAGRQDHGGGGDLGPLAGHVGQNAAYAAGDVRQQRQGADVLADLDVGAGPGLGRDGQHDGAAGAVATDAGDAGAGVGRLQALHEAAVRIAVERRAEIRQPAEGRWTLAGEDVDGLRLAEAGAGGQGVGGVEGGGVIGGHGHGDAALGPGRGAALVQRRGAEHQDAARCGGQGGGEAGEAGADDDDAVMVKAVGHG